MSLKIMVVDEPKSQTQLRALAAPLRHTVLVFQDYLAAAQKGEEQRFDVVFVGMRGPEPSGPVLARHLRDSQANHDAFIVMLSTVNDVATMRAAFAHGADLVLTKPVSSDRLLRMLAAMDAPGWKNKRAATRLPLFTEVACAWNGQRFKLRSLNLSESGMLLQPSVDAEPGQEVTLEFKIPEAGEALKVAARIVRKEGQERVGVEFVGLTPEDKNSIELYITGHMKALTHARNLSGIGMHRLLNPFE
jgi:CheY-like chemotaxis protein